MNETKIVTRIDELGRIVIPKQIRSSLRINNGDNLEIYQTSEQEIVISKHSVLYNNRDLLTKYASSIYSTMKLDMIIVDNNRIIEVMGNCHHKLIGKRIDMVLQSHMQKRISQYFNRLNKLNLCDDIKIEKNAMLKPIVLNQSVIGAIIVIFDNEIEESVVNLIEQSTSFLVSYLK